MASGLMIGVESSDEAARAVLLDGGTIRASVAHTAPAGAGRVADLLGELVQLAPEAGQARGVAVATTFFETALAQRVGLARVGCVRLTESDDDAVPPLFGWPADLLAQVDGGHALLRGGCGHDGTRTDGPTSGQLAEVGARLTADGARAFAVTAVVAPVDATAEREAGLALQALFPDIPVALSLALGTIGLLDRENTTVLNAALLPLATRATADLDAEVSAVLPGVRPYLTRPDGTVMELPFASLFPVFTVGSVGAARLRGAARQAGYAVCLVAEVVAGQRRVAVVRDGEPTWSPHGRTVAGVRTALPSLEMAAVEGGEHGWALAARSTGVGEAPWVAAHEGVGMPVAASQEVAWAVAIGAASTRIAGLVDRIVPGGRQRDGQVVEQARGLASQQALLAGAVEDSISVLDVEEIPLAYVPGDLVRLRVRAMGELP